MLVYNMDEGFILSNKFRRVIFDELASGEKDIYRISKKNRIFLKTVIKTVNEFINIGIIEKKNNQYFLTIKGKKLADIIR